MSTPYKYTNETTSSLNTGYFIEKNSLDVIVASTSSNLLFGKLEDDVKEFSVYDMSGELMGWKQIQNDASLTQIDRTYIDIDGNLIDYSFGLIDSDFFSVKEEDSNTRNLVVSPVDDLKSLGLSNGSYKIAYTLLHNVIGSDEESLEISAISPSRTELKVIPSYRPSEDRYINDQFNKVLNDSIFGKEVVDSIIGRVEEKQLDKIYLDSVDEGSNERLIQEIKLLYVLPRDVDFINFLDGILISFDEKPKTISYQFQNWLFSKFNEELTFDDIREFYSETIDNLIRFHLTAKSTLVSPDFEEYVSYFKSLFDQVFAESIDFAESLYFERNNIYLKHFLNFGNNELLPVVNYIGSGENVESDDKYQPLLIKLTEPLPEKYDVKSKLVFNRLVINPLFNDVIFYQNQVIALDKIQGPNFYINESEALFSTKEYSHDSIAPSGSLELLLAEEDVDKSINVDYRHFDNFIKFSSAVARVTNYDVKLNQINDLDDEVDAIDAQLVDMPNDPYHLLDKNTKLREIDDIKKGFDGYETFLFNNPEWYVEHTAPVGVTAQDGTFETSASLYDEWNDESLIHNTPDFIVEDLQNVDYLNFVNMAGQMFDDIWIHIDNIPTVTPTENRSDIGLSDDMIKTMLKSLGWTPENGSQDIDLMLSLTGDDPEVASLEEIPAKKRTQIVWKRILNVLPHLLKTKGSEECIRSLFTCYGIPRSLYSIREFGGIRKIDKTQDDNLFLFDNDFYGLKFDGSHEYLECEWGEDIQTVEFKFSFDDTKTYDTGEIFRLAAVEDRWVIGAIREKGTDWGKVFFTLARDPNDNASIKTLATERMPIFNGDLFTIMVRKNNPEEYFNLTDEQTSDIDFLDTIPLKYDLVVKRALDGRMLFEEETSFYFSGSFNSTFRSPGTASVVNIGNYNQTVSNLVPDPEAFYGVIDQVKFFNVPVDDVRFDSHVNFISGYDTDLPDTTAESLRLHLNFNEPSDLFSGSTSQSLSNGYVEIENDSISTTELSAIKAYRFNDLSTSQSYDDVGDDCCEQLPEVFEYVSSSFPWHFEKFQTREMVKIPDYGAAKFRSNNVNYISQEVEKPLFYDSRTTKPSSKVKTKGADGLGVFFSPVDELNSRIIEFFGDFDISDFIGDPREIYRNEYKTFRVFKRNFQNTGLQNMDFQGYINLIRSYIDNSLYKHLKTLVPAKSTFRTGILIEPSILERDKVQARPIEREIHNNLGGEEEAFKEATSEILFGDKKDGNEFVDSLYPINSGSVAVPRNFYTFVDSDPDTHGFGTFSENGVVWQNGTRYYAEIIKETKTMFRFDDTVSGNDEIDVTGSFEKINLIPLGETALTASLSSPDSRILDGYHSRHYKFKQNTFSGITDQTQETTIDPKSGVPDGSVVVELTTVDRNRVNVGTEGEGVVLDSDD